MHIAWKLATAAGVGLFATLAVSGRSFAEEPGALESGTWQKHQYSFQFMGFTSTYSCDGLAAKIKLLLIAAGARPDAMSQPGACAGGFGQPDKFARADLTFYTLAPGPGGDSGEKPVNGAWRAVSFAYHSPWDLATGDCELVEQFRHSVLPMFTTRNIEDRTTCVPHQESGSLIGLKFDSFAPPPAPKAVARSGG